MSNGNENILQCPAIDSAYVDNYTDDPAWEAATQEQKDKAIMDACSYFRANYTCPYVDYSEALPVEIQNAVAEFAILDINGGLYSTTNQERITSKSLKAGSASISKTFSAGVSQKDPTFLKVSDMVSPYCTFTGGTVQAIIRA